MGFWRQRAIGLIAIAVLGGTPLLVALCAGLCAPGQGHHAGPHDAPPAAAASCHEAPGTGVSLGALDAGDCVSHAGTSVDLATARATGRDDGWAVAATVETWNGHTAVPDPQALRGLAAHGRLRLPPPRAHAPTALRI